MTPTAALLASLEVITHETTRMLAVLGDRGLPPNDQREATRRAYELRTRAQEFCDWLTEVRPEDLKN